MGREARDSPGVRYAGSQKIDSRKVDLGGACVLDNPGLRRPEHGVAGLDRDLLELAAFRGDLERAALEINRHTRLLAVQCLARPQRAVDGDDLVVPKLFRLNGGTGDARKTE